MVPVDVAVVSCVQSYLHGYRNRAILMFLHKHIGEGLVCGEYGKGLCKKDVYGCDQKIPLSGLDFYRFMNKYHLRTT